MPASLNARDFHDAKVTARSRSPDAASRAYTAAVSDWDFWREAVTLLEAGEYWAAHEALEARWLTSDGIDREFLGGVILLAAALHKARAQGSARGARRNYAKALRHLALVPDEHRAVEVRELEARVHAALRDPALPLRVPVALGAEHSGFDTERVSA